MTQLENFTLFPLGDQTSTPSFPGPRTEVCGHPCPLLLTLGRHHPPTFAHNRLPQPSGQDPLRDHLHAERKTPNGASLSPKPQLSSEILARDPYFNVGSPSLIWSRTLLTPGPGQMSATLWPAGRSRPQPLGPSLGSRTQTIPRSPIQTSEDSLPSSGM